MRRLLSFPSDRRSIHFLPLALISPKSSSAPNFLPNKSSLPNCSRSTSKPVPAFTWTRKTNLGGTLLVHKAMQAGQVDLYVEYTGTALNAVLNETSDRRFRRRVPARQTAVRRSDSILKLPSRWVSKTPSPWSSAATTPSASSSAHVGHSFRSPPSGASALVSNFSSDPTAFAGWSQRYGLHFAQPPSVMDLGLIYRALAGSQSRHRRWQLHRWRHRLASSGHSGRRPPLLPAVRRRAHRAPSHAREISATPRGTWRS